MNYFKLIFSNKSILRIFQQEVFKEFKIEGQIIEFGASEIIHKNFCYSNLENCNITYSNINPSNKKFINLDLQKKSQQKQSMIALLFLMCLNISLTQI